MDPSPGAHVCRFRLSRKLAPLRSRLVCFLVWQGCSGASLCRSTALGVS